MQQQWGPYPFDTIGGVVPDGDIAWAPEPQTRPVYGKLMWRTSESNILTVVHENSHQWFGNSVSLNEWRDIWLTESFARYAEWLWTEAHGGTSAQQQFDDLDAGHPADDPWWTLKVADPGGGHIFDDAVYGRGAMTLQALRNRLGDTAFRELLRGWATTRRYGNASIEDFIAHAVETTGLDLRGFFTDWLFTGTKPASTEANGYRAPGHTAR